MALEYLYQKTKKRRVKRGFWKRLIFLVKTCFGLFFFSVLGGIIVFAYFAKDLPDPEKINKIQIVQSTKIYARDEKTILYDIHGEEKRTIIPLDQISDYVKNATITIEDQNFYKHRGFDVSGIARAIKDVVLKQKLTGASTLTQQFIKNTLLTPERTVTRKIKEIILAFELERRYSKDQILGFYLNQVPYGSNAYGIEAASQTYFNKSAKNLTLAESALLAALPKAPSRLSPYGSHPEELEARKNYILERMYQLGYISQEEEESAQEEKLRFAKNIQNIKAPHFIMYVKEYLEKEYGQEFVEKAGLKVVTTLDWDLQKTAEEILEKYAPINKKSFGASNAALTAIDPQTGQILAMVGSVDYFDIENEGNVNVSIRDRQPGSAFKPFVYAVALEKGFTPDTIIFDVPTEFALPGTPSYKPENYDGKFRGPVSMRQALAQSLNAPSVKVLYLAGINETIDQAKKMGITTLNEPSRYGLSLVLGGGEVKLLDMVSAFGVFAQEGKKQPPVSILKIKTGDEKILEEYKKNEAQQVLSPQVANIINNILSDESTRAPMFGSKSKLYIESQQVAVKTGTTQEYRDAWTVGYAPNISVGVWVGNNRNQPMYNKADGSYAAAPIWNEFMVNTLKKLEKKGFSPPKPINTKKPILSGEYIVKETLKFDKFSGKLATPLTPPSFIEEREVKEVHNILHWVNKNNPQGEYPQNPSQDPQYKNWEEGVFNWLKNQKGEEFEGIGGVYLPGYDDAHSPKNQPSLDIISPKNNGVLDGNILNVKITSKAPLGIKQFDFFLNEKFLGTRAPTETLEYYDFQFNLPNADSFTKLILSVRVYDKAGNTENEFITFWQKPSILLP